MASPAERQVSWGSVGYVTRHSPEKSDGNQDCIAVVECGADALVLIVADGVGGEAFGDKASALAVDAVVQALTAATGTEDLRPAILDGIEHANRRVLELGTGSATTLAIAELHPGSIRGYHVGDSMTLVFGSRGLLKWRSVAHSPVGYAVESGLMEEAEAMFHEDRHLVSNLVGTEEMHIEVGPPFALAPRDTVVVASDGLFDNLHLDEILLLGRRGTALHRVTQLADLATQRMNIEAAGLPSKPDDLSILQFVPGV
ncbi:MAG: protein phosphatase 2C domain-containing protein [Planctomycetaceae bacterium]|nr:protein phosphatase 2C domain-containing protein [Planctomycetaceae bacterium]